MREIMLNASYLLMFRNVRDKGQTKLLERQTGIKDLYKVITASPLTNLYHC